MIIKPNIETFETYISFAPYDDLCDLMENGQADYESVSECIRKNEKIFIEESESSKTKSDGDVKQLVCFYSLLINTLGDDFIKKYKKDFPNETIIVDLATLFSFTIITEEDKILNQELAGFYADLMNQIVNMITSLNCTYALMLYDGNGVSIEGTDLFYSKVDGSAKKLNKITLSVSLKNLMLTAKETGKRCGFFIICEDCMGGFAINNGHIEEMNLKNIPGGLQEVLLLNDSIKIKTIKEIWENNHGKR